MADYYKMGYKELRAAAVRGEVEAQATLGIILDGGGLGFKSDSQESVRWLSQASACGHAEAQRTLAHFYLLGEGPVERDLVKGMWLMVRASRNGSKKAVDNLAMYRAREDYRALIDAMVQQPDADAECLFRVAEEVKGKGDEGLAALYYLEAARKGHPLAQVAVGLRYFDQKNYVHAYAWLETAAPALSGDWSTVLGVREIAEMKMTQDERSIAIGFVKALETTVAPHVMQARLPELR